MASTAQLSADRASSLRRSLATTAWTTGSTHDFYRYPARFHPDVAREAIRAFSRHGEWILDPFMGGATSIVEALQIGRKAVGCDINALARFIAEVRTRPLSAKDKAELRMWVAQATTTRDRRLSGAGPARVVNLPTDAEIFLGRALELTWGMLPRRRKFARAVLLRLGQVMLDCRDFDGPTQEQFASRLSPLAEEMLCGLDDFVERCRSIGTPKNQITHQRLLLHRSAVGMETDSNLQGVVGRPRLVLTSPPYPGVHVLYHRWQYLGRRETPAPYWIAGVEDGLGAAHYCGGSRTPTGLRNYYRMIVSAFRSVAGMMHPQGHVVQIIGFSNARSQLSGYLEAMERAGLRDVSTEELGQGTARRKVANRKWYARIKGDIDASREYLFVHRPR